jgi:hypothetical protein
MATERTLLAIRVDGERLNQLNREVRSIARDPLRARAVAAKLPAAATGTGRGSGRPLPVGSLALSTLIRGAGVGAGPAAPAGVRDGVVGADVGRGRRPAPAAGVEGPRAGGAGLPPCPCPGGAAMTDEGTEF